MTQLEHLKINEQLPSPKGVALAVLELSRRENVTLGDIAHVVQSDPALSGRLIKLANSGSQISRPVVSIQEAVARQGVKAVCQLALGFSLLDQYRAGSCDSFDYPKYWSHSLLMGLAMQSLGQRVRVGASDELFVCGLLAQIGQLALATVYPDKYNAVLAAHQASPTQRLAIHERTHLETDHIELGAAMMGKWGVPKVFTQPLALYENPDQASDSLDSRSNSLVLMLHLAHRLADIGLSEADQRPNMAQAWLTLAAKLDIQIDEAGIFIDEVIADWHDWGTLLHIQTAPLPAFADMAREEIIVAAHAANASSLRIVVADSNAFTRRKTMALLAEAGGHTVYPASDGKAALALVMEVIPHVIISHFNLQQSDDLAFFQALRQADEGRSMYILQMDDIHNEERSIQAYEVGADGYVPSTISARALHARLLAAQRLMHLKQALEQDRANLRLVAAELALTNRRLANAALTDQLTGLPNRRSAMDQIEQAWSAAARTDSPLSVMVIDIDHFKHINDTYGHATGDNVLREAADTLRAATRREDSLCRIGGEEFLVICPNTTLSAAMQSAERLRTALETKHIAIGQSVQSIHASIGVATREAGIIDTDALISAADQALYLAKDGGRNQTRSRQSAS